MREGGIDIAKKGGFGGKARRTLLGSLNQGEFGNPWENLGASSQKKIRERLWGKARGPERRARNHLEVEKVARGASTKGRGTTAGWFYGGRGVTGLQLRGHVSSGS